MHSNISDTIINCSVSAGFCEVVRKEELISLETPESIRDDLTKEEYEGWMTTAFLQLQELQKLNLPEKNFKEI